MNGCIFEKPCAAGDAAPSARAARDIGLAALARASKRIRFACGCERHVIFLFLTRRT